MFACDFSPKRVRGKPKPQPTIRPGTLRHPNVVRAVESHLDHATAAIESGCSVKLTTERLHELVLGTCVQHQKNQSRETGKRRATIVKRICSLQEKLSGAPPLESMLRSTRNLSRYQAKLQKLDHDARRRREAQQDYEQQMTAAGQGRAAKPIAKPLPVTEVVVPKAGPLREGESRASVTLTDPSEMLEATSAVHQRVFNMKRELTQKAERDAIQILEKLKADTADALPPALKDALRSDRIISVRNITAAIDALSRNSTPGVDRIPLEFYLTHKKRVAPLLSRLFAESLADGRMSDSMVRAVLSPIYKEKGSPADPLMYRPISVTTMAYRIFAKCIAQRLNIAVKYLIGDPQVGYCPGRTLDENVALIRHTIHDINNCRPHDGGLLLMLDNTKAFDRLQHDFMFRTLEAFNLPSCLIDAVRTLYKDAEISVKLNGQRGAPFTCSSGVKQGCPLSALLYILVQEVQMRMIRDDPRIQGIPIPDADGREPPIARRVHPDPTTCTVKERCLVDDMLVGLRSPASIPPLLEVLDRFEAISNHKMNLSKTILLLLGQHRDFDVHGDSEAARRLCKRGLTATHDIADGAAARALPEKCTFCGL